MCGESIYFADYETSSSLQTLNVRCVHVNYYILMNLHLTSKRQDEATKTFHGAAMRGDDDLSMYVVRTFLPLVFKNILQNCLPRRNRNLKKVRWFSRVFSWFPALFPFAVEITDKRGFLVTCSGSGLQYLFVLKFATSHECFLFNL